MPQDSMSSSSKYPVQKKSRFPRGRSYASESDVPSFSHMRSEEGDSALPLMIRGRLYELFGKIEKEFETLYLENLTLQEKLDLLSEKLEQESVAGADNRNSELADGDGVLVKPTKKSSQAGQLIKTTHKLKAQTSKIVSSFKAPSVTCNMVREYAGHRDGIWHVAVARGGLPIIGTASADHTACLWSTDTGACVLQYLGHDGSVNSIRFHPSQDLVLTSSGDCSAHIWRGNVGAGLEIQRGHSLEDDNDGLDNNDQNNDDGDALLGGKVIRNPIHSLRCHSNVVIAADWLSGGNEIITASWDRSAILYDAITGEMVESLTGHDQELTNVCTHPHQRLVVTCSKDSTFRLWDLRETTHAVSVFQGHSETVTSANFVGSDKVVTGSDDRCVKVWDMKNMRSPLVTIRTDSAVNGLSVSARLQMMAVPQDNRNVRLYDLSGARLGRLPRSNRQGHHRMVCSAVWADESPLATASNLFTCGFDRRVISWLALPVTKENKEGKD